MLTTTKMTTSKNNLNAPSSAPESKKPTSKQKQQQEERKEPSPPPRIPVCHAAEELRVKPAPRPSKQMTTITTSSTSVITQQQQQPTPGRNKHKKDEEWKEVVRKSKKITVPSNLISRVIGRGGCNIKAIREVTGAHIDINKQRKGLERTITIRGPVESIRHAHELINELTKDKNSDCDIQVLIASMQKKFASTPKPTPISSHPPQPMIVESTTLRNAPSSNTTPIKNIPKTVAPTHRRPVGKPKELTPPSSNMQNDVEKNIVDKLPKAAAPAPMPSMVSHVSMKTSENAVPPMIPIPATISSAASLPISTAPTVATSHISTAPLPFMGRPTGKAINRPVQPVAPMISLKSSPYKMQISAPGAHIPTFTTASYSPADSTTWQSAPMRPTTMDEHQRAMRQFDSVRPNPIQPPNLYSYNDRSNEMVTSPFISQQIQQQNTAYSANNQQQQASKTSVWDPDIQQESSIAPVIQQHHQQQIPVNNVQTNNTTTGDVQQERKIWPIGTERAISHRRSAVLHPEQSQQHIPSNNTSLWTMTRPMPEPDSYTNWAGSGNQNPLWQNAINSNASLGGRVPPLPPKQVDNRFGSADIMSGDARNIAPAPIRPEKRDAIEFANTVTSIYQQQAANMNKLMMSNGSGVGTQPPIGSHLGNSTIDSANRSIAVAPQPINQLQVGAFKNSFGGGLPNQMHPFVGMSAGNPGYPYDTNEHKNIFAAARDGNKREPSMMQEQFSRYPSQMPFNDRLQEMESMTAFNSQMMMPQNVRMSSMMQKDMSMFQRNVGIRQPNVSSSQQKNNETDPSMLFSGSSGAVNYMATKDSSNWGW